MSAEQLTTIITNILTGSGVLTFMYFLVKSLRREIASLHKTIEAQKQTLEVMEKQVTETEKVGNIYRNLISELPDYIEKYKKIISATKDSVIAELENAIQVKDEKLKDARELELKRLELQEQMLAELPKLREELISTTKAIQGRVETFDWITVENPFIKTTYRVGDLLFPNFNVVDSIRIYDSTIDPIGDKPSEETAQDHETEEDI